MPEIATRYGTFSVPSVKLDVVIDHLTRFGEWADMETEFISDNIRDGSRLVDIGAFVGTFGISLSQKRKLSSVYFVEANANIASFLTKNVEANCRAPSVVLESAICGDAREMTQVYRTADNEGSISFTLRPGAEPAPDVPLPPVLTLETLRERTGPFDLLKLDVEGLEFAILKQAEPLLRKEQFLVWAECNEAISSLDLADLMLACGLKLYYFAFPAFNPKNFNGDLKPIFPFAYESGLLGSQQEPIINDSLVARGCMLKAITNREDLRRLLWQTPRWCHPEIIKESVQESLALAMRALQGERFNEFLIEKPHPARAISSRPPIEDLQNGFGQLALEESNLRSILQRNDKVAKKRLLEISALQGEVARKESDMRRNLEQLQWLETVADHRLALLQASLAAHSQLEQSTMWRVLGPVRRLFARNPRLRGVLKATLRPFVRIYRQLQKM